MLTENQIALVRDWIGDSEPPDDDELFEIYEREGTITDVAISVTRKRIATLASGGAINFTIHGKYSENRADNLKALQEMLKTLMASGIPGDDDYSGSGVVTIGNVGRHWAR